MIVLKSSRELELMKEACQISAEALMVAGEAVKPGASTKEIDEIAYKFIKKHGATPNFLNYGGFPAASQRLTEFSKRVTLSASIWVRLKTDITATMLLHLLAEL